MFSKSGFELKYILQNKGTIKRFLVPKMSECFSSEYESLRYFEAVPHKNYKSVVVRNKENELFVYAKGDPFDMTTTCNKSSLTYNYS